MVTPALPAWPLTGHPQRALRGWLHAFLVERGPRPTETLVMAARGFGPDEVEATLDLLLGTGLIEMGPEAWHALAVRGGSVDAAILSAAAGVLQVEPADPATLGHWLLVGERIALDLLEELRDDGRAAPLDAARWALVPLGGPPEHLTRFQRRLRAMRHLQHRWYHRDSLPAPDRDKLFTACRRAEQLADEGLTDPADAGDRLAPLARLVRDRQTRYFRGERDLLKEAKALESRLDRALKEAGTGQVGLFGLEG